MLKQPQLDLLRDFVPELLHVVRVVVQGEAPEGRSPELAFGDFLRQKRIILFAKYEVRQQLLREVELGLLLLQGIVRPLKRHDGVLVVAGVLAEGGLWCGMEIPSARARSYPCRTRSRRSMCPAPQGPNLDTFPRWPRR